MEGVVAYGCCDDQQREIDPAVYITFGLVFAAVCAALGVTLVTQAEAVNAKLSGLGTLAFSLWLANFSVSNRS